MKELLGQSVTYVKLDDKGEVVHGTGIVAAVFLNVDKRVQVRILDNSVAVNADYAAINTTSAGEERYIEGARLIRKRADEINDEIKKYTAAGNAELEVLYTKYLGEPIAC